jgi:hypothetical protein
MENKEYKVIAEGVLSKIIYADNVEITKDEKESIVNKA